MWQHCGDSVQMCCRHAVQQPRERESRKARCLAVVSFDEGHGLSLEQVSLAVENVAKRLHFHVSQVGPMGPRPGNGSGQSTFIIVTQPDAPQRCTAVSDRLARSFALARLVNLMQWPSN